MPTSQDVLRTSIETYNDAFALLLSLIPLKYCLVEKKVPDKNQRASKQAPKEASKRARRESSTQQTKNRP
ncbi:hypothetical protein HD554DRAFT_2111073 [Boletus coccyginus]|nr:hypothetical protein HD554DRAFT_2111073 [Boletus coccyginus]